MYSMFQVINSAAKTYYMSAGKVCAVTKMFTKRAKTITNFYISKASYRYLYIISCSA